MVRRPVTSSYWKTLSTPEAHPGLPLDIPYSESEFNEIRMGLYPLEMEDKWFVYYEEPWLYLHRSWTGMLAYRVRLEPDERGLQATEAVVHFEPQQSDADEAEHIERLIQALLTSHAPESSRERSVASPPPVNGKLSRPVGVGAGRHRVRPASGLRPPPPRHQHLDTRS
jgi:hypothetical protein